MYFERESLTLLLRTKDLDKTVRVPIGANKANEILGHLQTWEGQMSSEWKVRASTNQEALERGNPRDYVEVYKGLSQLEAEGTLRASDRAHLNQSLELLSEELANALGKTLEQARKQIASF